MRFASLKTASLLLALSAMGGPALPAAAQAAPPPRPARRATRIVASAAEAERIMWNKEVERKKAEKRARQQASGRVSKGRRK